MEYKTHLDKDKKLEKSFKNKTCEEILTPETMLMEYPGLEKVKNEYGDFSNFPNFSNFNNWPHSR